jgi:hypothetical protein
VLLFLFIPLVLFLFVRHPEPIGASVLAGVVLMLGHRLLARPYMLRALPLKCLWCNRVLAPDDLSGPGETLELRTRGGVLQARCCPGHRRPAAKLFAFLETWRLVLRIGIFVPLVLLLAALARAAFGLFAPVPAATALFQLVVGVTVNLAAFGYLAMAPRESAAVPFPVHNFFLLGVRNLLWVFRLIGIWWIWKGLSFFLGLP